MMFKSALDDSPQTVELLRSMTKLMSWIRSLPAAERQRVWLALANCTDEQQATVSRLLAVVERSRSTAVERRQALATIFDSLGLRADRHADDAQNAKASQQETFAARLRELMDSRCVSQQELADRLGCSQPAISQLLNRSRRPQKQTILKLAEALGVTPQDLWPDMAVAETLDAVQGFQEDDHVMSDAEAAALRDPSNRNKSKIPPRSLPKRRR